MLDFGQVRLENVFQYITTENASWEDPLLIPSYVSLLSAVTLLAHAAVRRYARKMLPDDKKDESDSQLTRFQRQIKDVGGLRLFVFRFVRLIVCFALVALSLAAESRKASLGPWMLAAYLYASWLALLSIASSFPWNAIATGHLNVVLLVPFSIYAYRDLWPLATYHLRPVDEAEGSFLWAKVVCLTFAAVLIPLAAPRKYIPVDSEDVSEPQEEDTASWLSLVFHSYNDPLVFKAYRLPQLEVENLPLLGESKKTNFLIKRSFKYLDPLISRSKRHIGLKLIFQVFPIEHLLMAATITAHSGLIMFTPIGINRLLIYLETGGGEAVIRPWFWILWIFAGSILASLADNWYYYLTTVTFVQSQAIVTQLIFDHALRIRVKAEVTKPAPVSGVSLDHARIPPAGDTSTTDGEDAVASESANPESTTAASASDSSDSTKAIKTEATNADQKKRNLAGKLNNLVTSDLDTLQQGQMLILVLFSTPTQIIFSIWFLYSLLGWSVFVGFGTMIALSPLPGLVAKLIGNTQANKMRMTDARVQTVTETIGMIRMVKLFGWEANMNHLIAEKREQELGFILKLKFLEVFNSIINSTLPIITIFVTYAIYALVLKQPLTASKIFASFTVFGVLENNLHMVFVFTALIIRGKFAKVSLDRIDEFLHESELLDRPADSQSQSRETPNSSADEVPIIGIRQTSFTWTDNETTTEGIPSLSSRNRFILRVENEVFFTPGCINLVVGQTGSGKTSLLMALLGEMHGIPTGPDSLISLPRQRGVAYHAQESWVLNETIRDNILFGAQYDEERYNAVLEQCALKSDLELFEAGDQTEVGEKGLTLSGGQKARVTLARAIYSTAGILLLDDVLAALDVHTARWIVEKCLKGNLVRGRTVILVTHNIALTTPVADFVVSMGTDGRILSQGTLSSALAKDANLSAELDRENEAIEKAEGDIPDTVPDAQAKVKSGKLIVEEEIAEGHLGWKALKLLIVNMAFKRRATLFWIVYFGLETIMKISDNMQSWVLALWSSRYEGSQSSDVPTTFYLCLYAGVACLTMIVMAIADVAFVFGSVQASRKIHALLVTSILESTLRWLDRTPVSRILTRCTQDIQAIDSNVPAYIHVFIHVTFLVVMKLGAVVLISPVFIIPGLGLLIAGVALGNVYMKAQLPVKRMSSNAKAPVLGHFGAAMSGLVSIRAYGAQEAFRKESFRRIDQYTRTQRPFWNMNRKVLVTLWIGVRMDLLSAIFVSGLAAYMTYVRHTTASKTGFSFNMAAALSGMIMFWVRLLNFIETSGNSLERIQQYLEIEHEPKPSQERVPPAYWPASGDLRVENLSARYSHDGPKVLHDISFHIASGERIGIVGRTGSGKSSLALALLRAIITEGKVYYDGLATDTLNLDALRSNITIIPQVPELLSGTLRHNLDPLSEHDDATLNDALRSAGLFSLQNQNTDNRLTLDTPISGGGSNLSVGQRQILALARALVRQSKIFILDEATSAIDYETDNIIQQSLRSELGKDVTLLTIAHRLQTIMDSDKIMVLDAGRLVEFARPSELLKNENSHFTALVNESGDKDALLAMVKPL